MSRILSSSSKIKLLSSPSLGIPLNEIIGFFTIAPTLLTIIINNVGSIVKKPIITFKGIPNNGESNNFIFALEDKIQSICKSYSLNNSKQEYNLIEALKTNCRKTVKEKTGKRPYTNVNLVRI